MKFATTLTLVTSLITLGFGIPEQKWHYSSDGCPYYIENEQSHNWYQAWEECLHKNMTLLTIDTFYKQVQIDAMVKQSFPKNISVWLAAHDNAVDRRYVWATTGHEFSFTNWAPTNPSRATNYHCICIWSSTNQWHDYTCASKIGFICEDWQCSKNKSPEHSGNSPRMYNIALYNLNAPK